MDRSSQKKKDPTPRIAEKYTDASHPEGTLVSTFALIWRVVYGRRFALPEADASDIAQDTALRLWRWREKFHEKGRGMTDAEWDSFTARAAHNEINRYLSKQPRNRVPLDEAEPTLSEHVEGDSRAEVASLIRKVWQEICKLTLYQRRALLLNSLELLIYFMQFGISESTIAASLEIDDDEWRVWAKRLPLSDREIAVIARSPKNRLYLNTNARAIRKARSDARRKLGMFKK